METINPTAQPTSPEDRQRTDRQLAELASRVSAENAKRKAAGEPLFSGAEMDALLEKIKSEGSDSEGELK